MSAKRLSLNAIYSIAATNEAGAYRLSVNLTDMSGDTYDCEYEARPDDVYGFYPFIREWISKNPDFPILPYQH